MNESDGVAHAPRSLSDVVASGWNQLSWSRVFVR